MTSDPTLESDAISNELNPVIGLLIFLLATPAFLAIFLQPGAQVVFRDAVAAFRKTNIFSSIFGKRESNGSSKAVAHSEAGSLSSGGTKFTHDNLQKISSPAILNRLATNIAESFDGSQISARRTTLPYPIQSESFA